VLDRNWAAPANPAMLGRLRALAAPCGPPPVAGGTYVISNAENALVLDLPDGSPRDGARLQQWSRHGRANQRWQLTDLGCGRYRITSAASGKAVDITDHGLADGAPVQQWRASAAGNQEFVLDPVGDGGDRIVNLNSGMPIARAGSAEAAAVLQHAGAPATGQRWRLQPA